MAVKEEENEAIVVFLGLEEWCEELRKFGGIYIEMF